MTAYMYYTYILYIFVTISSFVILYKGGYHQTHNCQKPGSEHDEANSHVVGG